VSPDLDRIAGVLVAVLIVVTVPARLLATISQQ
jgi:hypothetical protein